MYDVEYHTINGYVSVSVLYHVHTYFTFRDTLGTYSIVRTSTLLRTDTNTLALKINIRLLGEEHMVLSQRYTVCTIEMYNIDMSTL